MTIFVFDTTESIINQLQNTILDGHCRYKKVPCLKNYVEVIYSETGYSEPVFTSMKQAMRPLRTYIC